MVLAAGSVQAPPATQRVGIVQLTGFVWVLPLWWHLFCPIASVLPVEHVPEHAEQVECRLQDPNTGLRQKPRVC